MALKCKVMSRIIGKNVGDWGKKMARTLRVASAQEQRVSGAVRASGSWLATSPKEAIRGWRMGTEVRRGMEFRKRSAHLIVLWTGGCVKSGSARTQRGQLARPSGPQTRDDHRVSSLSVPHGVSFHAHRNDVGIEVLLVANGTRVLAE